KVEVNVAPATPGTGVCPRIAAGVCAFASPTYRSPPVDVWPENASVPVALIPGRRRNVNAAPPGSPGAGVPSRATWVRAPGALVAVTAGPVSAALNTTSPEALRATRSSIRPKAVPASVPGAARPVAATTVTGTAARAAGGRISTVASAAAAAQAMRQSSVFA